MSHSPEFLKIVNASKARVRETDVAGADEIMRNDPNALLIDVRKDDYLGTDTPRNYSSDVRLVDPTRSVDREVHIWMNNPLRFAGETFYQSGYNLDRSTGKESTTLAVVTNTGWMIPYVSCMLVAVGMLAHFAITLLRFLNRRAAAGSLHLKTPRQPTAPSAGRMRAYTRDCSDARR